MAAQVLSNGIRLIVWSLGLRSDPPGQCSDLRREGIGQLQVFCSNPVGISSTGSTQLDNGRANYIGVDEILFPGHDGRL